MGISYRRCRVAACPEGLATEVSFLPSQPGHRNCTLALQESDHRRHRVLRRYLDTHRQVVRHQVSFYDPTFLLLRQGMENLAQLPAYRTIDGLPPLELWWISLAEYDVGRVNASCRIAGIDHQA
jgi:hypothetical protein